MNISKISINWPVYRAHTTCIGGCAWDRYFAITSMVGKDITAKTINMIATCLLFRYLSRKLTKNMMLLVVALAAIQS